MGLLNNIRAIAQKPPGDDESHSSAPPPAGGPKKVLIVEDEKALADALSIKFKHIGFEVFRGENGQEGLDLFVAHKPDIILLDLMMPIMDGKSMLRALREIPEGKTVPVIVLTNAGDIDNMRETHLYYNANDFLIKSNISLEQVVEKVTGLIGS